MGTAVLERPRDSEKRNVMAKNIVEEINDKEMEKGLVLNTSYDIFYLGKSISKYDNLVHYKSQYENSNYYLHGIDGF